MVNRKIFAIYFSPTDRTNKVIHLIAKGIGFPVEFLNITLPHNRSKCFTFNSDDIVIIGSPTYAGRIPNKIVDFYQNNLIGNKAKAISVVTYGNRSFDYSLNELNNYLLANNFSIMFSTAVPCEHAFTKLLATGRPNKEDAKQLTDFGKEIKNALLSSTDSLYETTSVGPYYIPKDMFGNPANFLKAKPLTNPTLCKGCGLCSRICPMNAIDHNDVSLVTGTCIKCQACIKKCPKGAKYFEEKAFLSHVKMLENNYTNPQEILFIDYTKKAT